jgi:Xaa-Pro dipeptidase
MYKNRIAKIFKIINNQIDAIIIKNNTDSYIDNNFFYFTGLEDGLFENCCAILFPNKKSELIISNLEFESAKKSNSNFNINVFYDKKSYDQLIKDLLKSSKCIGLNYCGLIYKDLIYLKKQLSNLKFIDISNKINILRLIKDSFEIKKIKNACKIVDKVVYKIPNVLYNGITENELAAEIDYLMLKNGAKKPAFETICAFGKNSAEPHYSHGNSKLKRGDFILCDFGANYIRYNSDITRTFIFGKPNDKQISIYDTVINAQNVAFNELNSGKYARDIHGKVYSYIENSQFKSFFTHSTGHSIGLNVHDVGGGLSSDSDIILKENMVFTVEPGIYIPEFGGVRIEDDILIKKDGYEILTKSKRNLISIN